MANKTEPCQRKKVQESKLLTETSNTISITKIEIIYPISEPKTSSKKMND